MSVKSNIKSALKLFFGKRPTILTANIVKLAPSQLLQGRAALITGGTSGIGFSIADAMLDAGAAAVVITGRSEGRLKDAVNKLVANKQARNGKVFYQTLDNCDVDSFETVLKEILQKIGMPLSILVNNAGVQGESFGKSTEKTYEAVMGTNLKGAYFLSQLVAHYMKDNKIKGNILNVGSSSSLRPASTEYTLSKWGIRGLTLGMAKALLPYDIVVNAIAPGPTATPMLIKDPEVGIAHPTNPNKRYAMPEEIASMAVMLTSGMGRTIVGDMVYMTGGAGLITFDDVPYPFD